MDDKDKRLFKVVAFAGEAVGVVRDASSRADAINRLRAVFSKTDFKTKEEVLLAGMTFGALATKGEVDKFTMMAMLALTMDMVSDAIDGTPTRTLH